MTKTSNQPRPAVAAREISVSLPQDSVLRAHLRRQADWPQDGPRLSRSSAEIKARRQLVEDVEKIGRQNQHGIIGDAGRDPQSGGKPSQATGGSRKGRGRK